MSDTKSNLVAKTIHHDPFKSVDALLGVEVMKRRAKATDTRLARRLQEVEKLGMAERRQIIQLIDAFIERGQLKRKAQGAKA